MFDAPATPCPLLLSVLTQKSPPELTATAAGAPGAPTLASTKLSPRLPLSSYPPAWDPGVVPDVTLEVPVAGVAPAGLVSGAKADRTLGGTGPGGKAAWTWGGRVSSVWG